LEGNANVLALAASRLIYSHPPVKMSTSSTNNEPTLASQLKPGPFGTTGASTWFSGLTFYNATSTLIKSVYVPEKQLSTGWWSFHCVFAVLAALFLMFNIGIVSWDMWQNVGPAWRELRGTESGKENSDRGWEDEPLLNDEKDEDLDMDHAEASPSPAQQHERDDGKEGATKKVDLRRSFIIMITLTLVYAGTHMCEDTSRLNKARNAGNDYFSPWIWLRRVETVLLGLAYLGVLGLLGIAVYVKIRQAKEEKQREGTAEIGMMSAQDGHETKG
jgi:hypothetical protein